MESRLCPPLLHLWSSCLLMPRPPHETPQPLERQTCSFCLHLPCPPTPPHAGLFPNRLATRLWGHEDAAETVLGKDLANW